MCDDCHGMTWGVRLRFAWMVLMNQVRLSSLKKTPGLTTAWASWHNNGYTD